MPTRAARKCLKIQLPSEGEGEESVCFVDDSLHVQSQFVDEGLPYFSIFFLRTVETSAPPR